MATPTDEDKEDLLLACRYGDLADVEQFVQNFGKDSLHDIKDENGNTLLHMVCGNGHLDILQYLLPIIPSALISTQNKAESTPLHWAALNAHLSIVQALVQFEGGPGVDLIDIKNAAGHTPLGEAELAGWDEGAKWFVQVMNLGSGDGVKEEDNDDSGNGGAEDNDISGRNIEVEIQDADGQIARMTISSSGEQSTNAEQ